MIRTATYVILGLGVAFLGYVLLCTGGVQYGAGFSAGNIDVAYTVKEVGVLKLKSLEYVVLSDGRCEEETIHAADGKDTSFTRVYRDAGTTTTVAFATKSGQTIWIGKDRKVRVASTPLNLRDVQVLAKHGGREVTQPVSSLEDLQAVIDKLKAEPDGPAPNGSQPIRSETNRTSSAAGSRR